MLSEFENFVKNEKLFTKKSRLLLAISGGADSVCLFHLLYKTGYRFELAHCNFGLRGKDSDADEVFVKQLAARYKVPVHIVRFDTKKESKRLKKGTQETARILRYEWFETLRVQEGFDCILTAHHLTDNTETMLINLLRSTGISGLHGILPVNGNIVRPLLFTDRKNIEAFIRRGRFAYRKDVSNEGDDYLRNRIRHHLLPEFEKLEPETDRAFAAVARHVSDFEKLAGQLLELHLQRFSEPAGKGLLISDKVFDHFQGRHILLYYLLKPYGFSMAQIAGYAAIRQPSTGSTISSVSHSLLRERNGYMLMPQSETQVVELTVKGPGIYTCANLCTLEFRYAKPDEVDFSLKNTLYFDAEKCGFPLVVRNWKAADRMRVLGMKGSKKISDILTDKKQAVTGRKSRLLLCSGEGNIMALLPDVCSELYKLNKSSVQILSLRFNTL